MEIPTILSGEYEPDFQQQLNQTLRTLLSINGWQLPNLNQAQIDDLTDATFAPILPPGTIWLNTDVAPNGKLQFITIAADPSGPTNATYETITST